MDEKWEQIQNLDLKTVNERLRRDKGFRWCRKHDPDRLEAEYRQFLYLIATNPGQMVVPWSQAMDDFWHIHILDTRKYAKDCQTVFGRFIHHNPHVPKGTSQHKNASKSTRQMYLEAFGERTKLPKFAHTLIPGCGSGHVPFAPVFAIPMTEGF